MQLPTAFVSAVVGVVDSIVAARENASMYGYDVSPNRELVALGESSQTETCADLTVISSFRRIKSRWLVNRRNRSNPRFRFHYPSVPQSPASPPLLRRSADTIAHISGSRLNGQIGSRTQMASIITSICMIFSIFFLLPYLYYLPKVCLFFPSVPNQNVLAFSR